MLVVPSRVGPSCKNSGAPKYNHTLDRCPTHRKKGSAKAVKEAAEKVDGWRCGTKQVFFNVDSGTTLHLVNNKDILTSKSLTYQPISTATNAVFIANSKGPIDTLELPLPEAFASTELHENLLSINQLDKDNYDTLFSGGKVYIGREFQIPKKVAVIGHRKNGAYYVTLNKPIHTR